MPELNTTRKLTPDPCTYWGKAGVGVDFHPLPFHALDVAAVGTQFLRTHPRLCELFTASLGVDAESLLKWIGFWLALHDLGKFAVSFQAQREDLLLRLQQRHVHVAYTVRHDSLGAAIWARLLRRHDALGVGARGAKYAGRLQPWINAVTGHHGQPPVPVTALTQYAEACDERAAAAFVHEARTLFLDDEARNRFLSLPVERLGDRRLSWWLSGVAVLADWLGSNTDYFPYHSDPAPLSLYWEKIQPQAATALANSGMQSLRRSHPKPVDELFGWGQDKPPKRATPLQQWAESVTLPAAPQLFLLEDVTGAGKTEAALELAQRLIAADLADGMFFGLPTMATANAMYTRVASVAEQLFDPQTPPSTVLAHGQRRLNHTFRDTILPRTPVEPATRAGRDETASARCTAWLADSNKKALLANIGVGTLDQALLAILHARHQSLRLLGLFRKVLIVDEVHACDAYMQRLLEKLLQFHAASGGSAILLTATLPQRMKQALADAYLNGRGAATTTLRNDNYPLVTHLFAGQTSEAETPLDTRPEVCRRVAVDYRDNVVDVIHCIQRALDQGKCVCWIRNTVADALAAWETFTSLHPADSMTLFHARFAMGDRLDIEARVTHQFGPASHAGLRQGQLVIATQVVEQSLDVDFDVLVSDLAPIDRLIQRAGRLQRHTRDKHGNPVKDSDQRGTPTLIVLGPAWTAQPDGNWYKKMFPTGAYVYPHSGQLWLTARWLNEHGAFAMPEDGRKMVESVYGDTAWGETPEPLQRASSESEGKDWAATNLAAKNTLVLEVGYRSVGQQQWAADSEALPVAALDEWGGAAATTRLGESTITARLARWQGNVLVPWRSGATESEAWEASSLRMPARLVGDPIVSDATQTAQARAEATMPDHGRWSRLIAMHQVGNQWMGEFSSPDGRRRVVYYDERCGLQYNAPATPIDPICMPTHAYQAAKK